MPVYEYERDDGSRFETIQGIRENPLFSCPTTGQGCRRVVSRCVMRIPMSQRAENEDFNRANREWVESPETQKLIRDGHLVPDTKHEGDMAGASSAGKFGEL